MVCRLLLISEPVLNKHTDILFNYTVAKLNFQSLLSSISERSENLIAMHLTTS